MRAVIKYVAIICGGFLFDFNDVTEEAPRKTQKGLAFYKIEHGNPKYIHSITKGQ